ncbi:MAG TPA: SPOR domain-containing protein [Treponema sp.]|nr:SPOR domain-containing protein [Treponema sp.]
MRYAVPLLALLLILIAPLEFAQSQTGGTIQNLSQEIETYQKQVQDKNRTGDSKKAAWLALAELQVLSGNFNAAAESFTEAAFSVQANRDDQALLRAALCYLYAGDVEHALSHIKTLLLTSRDNHVIGEAQQMGLLIDIFRGEGSALQNLEQLVKDPSQSGDISNLLYILYTLTGKEIYRDRITKDYSASLAAALLEGKSVTFKHSPLWLFGASEPKAQLKPEPALTPEEKAPSQEVQLQVGLFSQQSNAQQMLERLQKKGFKGTLGQRMVNNTQYWIITIPGGEKYNDTIMQLKDAGFEAFPLFPEK